MIRTLTEKNARDGLSLQNKAHPEWGTWQLRRGMRYWTIRGRSGERVLDEGEFDFWEIVSIPENVTSDMLSVGDEVEVLSGARKGEIVTVTQIGERTIIVKDSNNVTLAKRAEHLTLKDW